MFKSKKIPLKKIIKEDIQDMVNLQGAKHSEEEANPTDISLDAKVDSFFVKYERESIPNSQMYQKENKKRLDPNSLINLFEADEDPNAPPAEEDDDSANLGDDPTLGSLGGGGGIGGGSGGGGDLGADLGGGGDKGKLPQQPVVQTPKININTFAKQLARLVNDYQELVDPKRIIMNRAQTYIEKNYNHQLAQELMTILDTEFNLSPRSQADKELDTPETFAVGALEPIGQ